jgi:hypothetical protein
MKGGLGLTGTGRDSACGGRKTVKRMVVLVAAEAWLYCWNQPPHAFHRFRSVRPAAAAMVGDRGLEGRTRGAEREMRRSYQLVLCNRWCARVSWAVKGGKDTGK